MRAMSTQERAERVEALFHAALELATGERADFLSDACAADEAVRVEVESLLQSHRPGGDFLESPALGISAAEVAARLLEEGESPVAGQRFGAYRLLREIGRGGAGAVYLAVRDDDEYRKQVAVKLLKRGRFTREVARRFRRERQILADLEHPNIARLLDGGTTETGLPYFVMEYVEGVAIDDYCDAHGLDLDARLKLFREVCAAVEFAHRRGVVHRDIKPSNILVTAEGTPNLIDFGIAKISPLARAARESAATPTAERAMTPEYASPEQMRGGTVGEASDVYSLGVLLYRLLAGRPPYRLAGKSPYEIVRAVCEEEVEKPSQAIGDCELRITDPKNPSSNPQSPIPNPKSLRGDLDNIVLTALRKEPARRYPSVSQLSEDIRRHLEGLPITARKDALTYRGAKFLRRNRAYAFPTLAVALLCLLIGASLALYVVRSRARGSVAVLPFTNTGGGPLAEYLCDGMTDVLIDDLSSLRRLSVSGRNSVFNYRGKAIDLRTAGRALGVETVLTGDLTKDGDIILINLSLSESSDGQLIWSKQYRGYILDIQTLQQEMAQDVAGELGFEYGEEQRRAQTPGTANAEAFALYLNGRYNWNKRTPFYLNRAYDYFRKATELDPNYALAYSGMADSYSVLGAYRRLRPAESFGKAKVAATKALEINPALPEGHASLALVKWLYEWDWAGAESEFRRAIELNPRYVLAHQWYGLFLGEMGRFDEAVAEEHRALQLDPLSVPVIANLGRVYFFARRYDKSLEQFKLAGTMGVSFGDLPVNTLDVFEQKGMVDELIPMQDNPALKQALATGDMKTYWRKKLELLDKHDWTCLYDEAVLLARLGENDRAAEQLNRAYDSRDHLMTQLKVNPAFDGLRADPHFIALLRRMNLDKYR
jgi:serine/threonine protein kinase/TolB-like protein